MTKDDIDSFITVGDGGRRMNGAWDSIHVFEVHERGRNANYKLTSTVMLYMITKGQELGDMNLSGSMTRQVKHSHIYKIWTVGTHFY